jgi:hypothetical protein
MKLVKMLFSFGLVIAILFSVSGCKDDDPPETPSEPDRSEVLEKMFGEDGTTTVKWYSSDGNDIGTRVREAIMAGRNTLLNPEKKLEVVTVFQENVTIVVVSSAITNGYSVNVGTKTIIIDIAHVDDANTMLAAVNVLSGGKVLSSS